MIDRRSSPQVQFYPHLSIEMCERHIVQDVATQLGVRMRRRAPRRRRDTWTQASYVCTLNSTRTLLEITAHIIPYLKGSKLKQAELLHELCYVRLKPKSTARRLRAAELTHKIRLLSLGRTNSGKQALLRDIRRLRKEVRNAQMSHV